MVLVHSPQPEGKFLVGDLLDGASLWTRRLPASLRPGIHACEISILARQPAGASYSTMQPPSATAGIFTGGIDTAGTILLPARCSATLSPGAVTPGITASVRVVIFLPGPGGLELNRQLDDLSRTFEAKLESPTTCDTLEIRFTCATQALPLSECHHSPD